MFEPDDTDKGIAVDRNSSRCHMQPMTSHIKHICVYCGSGEGANPRYAEAADQLASAFVREEIGLVYGGGNVGLMGIIAQSMLRNGGHVTGIIPDFMSEWEVTLHEIQSLVVTQTMHERKQLMFEHSDAFVALPGGIGTLEELVEQMTWAQLGQHTKPIVLVDIEGFWQPFLDLLEHMRDHHFIRKEWDVKSLKVVREASDVIPAIRALAADRAAPEAEELIISKI